MYGREELEYHIIRAEDLYEEKVYLKNQADKVMNAMERRIARLTALVEGWKRNSVVLSEMYHKRLEEVQNTMATENVDLGIENHKLKERIKELENNIQLIEKNTDYWADRCKELEATISKMETTTPKWISVDDELPKEGEEVIAFYTSWKHEYQQVAMFESGEFIDLGGCALSPTHWMPLPPPPTNEST